MYKHSAHLLVYMRLVYSETPFNRTPYTPDSILYQTCQLWSSQIFLFQHSLTDINWNPFLTVHFCPESVWLCGVLLSFFFNGRVSLNYYFDSPNWLITTFFLLFSFFFSAFITCVILLYMSVLKTMYYVHVWNKICSVLFCSVYAREKKIRSMAIVYPKLTVG